jgi:hypothetical protein
MWQAVTCTVTLLGMVHLSLTFLLLPTITTLANGGLLVASHAVGNTPHSLISYLMLLRWRWQARCQRMLKVFRKSLLMAQGFMFAGLGRIGDQRTVWGRGPAQN